MNLLWLWSCKHFHLVFLFISILFLSLVASMSAGDDPTEEPEENFSNSATPSTHPVDTPTRSSYISFLNETKLSTESIYTPEEAFWNLKDDADELNLGNAEDHSKVRSLFLPSLTTGNILSWRTAGWMLKRGLRMFRESLVEGTKVAHMFKEDLDEGMTSIMRQNRGVKADPQSGQTENSAFGSLFDSQMLREGVLGGILRFMGVNSKQMGVIALNVLIILAEWITSSMIGNNEVAGATSRMIKSNLLQWANTGRNLEVENIISQAKSHTLPEKLIDKLSEKTGNSTSCVQLLICKMSPVIWGFQDTVKEQLHNFGVYEETAWKTASTTTSESPSIKSNSTDFNESTDNNLFNEPRGLLETSQYLVDKFMGHLPEKERIIDFGNRCETKFPQCHLLKIRSEK